MIPKIKIPTISIMNTIELSQDIVSDSSELHSQLNQSNHEVSCIGGQQPLQKSAISDIGESEENKTLVIRELCQKAEGQFSKLDNLLNIAGSEISQLQQCTLIEDKKIQEPFQNS